jgi:protein JSN1
MIDRYRPPALRALASGGSSPNEVSPSTTITPTDSSSLPINTYSSGYRRARAGTLPSNMSLAAQQYAASNTPSPSTLTPRESFNDQLQLLPQSSATPPAPMRPALRHSASVASPIASTVSVLTERSSRLRSGSLTTLPSTGLSNPFGSSIFSSSSWLTSSGNNTAFPVLEEIRSMDPGADDFDVHTLDYLGLDETHHHRPPPAATISELRNQAQAVIAGNMSNPSRLRAMTVSHPYRRMSTTGNSLLPPRTRRTKRMCTNRPTVARH